jgi:hypothetical protein
MEKAGRFPDQDEPLQNDLLGQTIEYEGPVHVYLSKAMPSFNVPRIILMKKHLHFPSLGTM